jgi:pimeloyl-ACP methyl ester carboxylesterase
MPAEASASLVPQIAKQARVKIYKNAAHGLYLTHANEVLEDILDFVFAS